MKGSRNPVWIAHGLPAEALMGNWQTGAVSQTGLQRRGALIVRGFRYGGAACEWA